MKITRILAVVLTVLIPGWVSAEDVALSTKECAIFQSSDESVELSLRDEKAWKQALEECARSLDEIKEITQQKPVSEDEADRQIKLCALKREQCRSNARSTENSQAITCLEIGQSCNESSAWVVGHFRRCMRYVDERYCKLTSREN